MLLNTSDENYKSFINRNNYFSQSKEGFNHILLILTDNIFSIIINYTL
jgi:hypothetical protein